MKEITVADLLEISRLEPVQAPPITYMDYTSNPPKETEEAVEYGVFEIAYARLDLMCRELNPMDDEAVLGVITEGPSPEWVEQVSDHHPVPDGMVEEFPLMHPPGGMEELVLALHPVTGRIARQILTEDSHIKQRVDTVRHSTRMTEESVKLLRIGDFTALANITVPLVSLGATRTG